MVNSQGFLKVVYTQGGRQVQGDKALMGGLIRGDINLMGGPNFDRLYHKLKVVIVKLQLHDAIYQLRFY